MAFQRKTRRGILFLVTLITIGLVISGTLFLAGSMETNPLLFTIFWLTCFVFAVVVIALAIIDLKMLRKEHRTRQVELDAELERIVADTKALAAESELNSDQS